MEMKHYFCALLIGSLMVFPLHAEWKNAQKIAKQIDKVIFTALTPKFCAFVMMCVLAEKTETVKNIKDMFFTDYQEYNLTKWTVGTGLLAWNLKSYILKNLNISGSNFENAITMGYLSLLCGKGYTFAFGKLPYSGGVKGGDTFFAAGAIFVGFLTQKIIGLLLNKYV